MQVSGDLTCQGAIFVFKSDDSAGYSWDAARTLEHVRVELHEQEAELLPALATWTNNVDPSNSFLCVYAHMGPEGIAPTGNGPWISWTRLHTALSATVYTLWLVGCNSTCVQAEWPTPRDSPVRGTMLATSEARNWRQLLVLFEQEVTFENVTPFNEMERRLRLLLECDTIDYFDAEDPSQWKHF